LDGWLVEMDLDTFETVAVFTIVACNILVLLWDGGADVAGVHLVWKINFFIFDLQF
jgi:hypothetical protein